MKRTRNYQRSEILSFFDLPEEVQERMHDECTDFEEKEAIEQDSYVQWGRFFFPLSDFMRYHGPIWDGVMGETNTSGYLIKISDNGEEAVVVHQY